jgi:hypothetical protein
MAGPATRMTRALRGFLAALTLLSASAGPALAAEWGGIEPGVTTLEEVRDRYGTPTRETPKKVENYDTIEWLYEGAQAPTGMVRMTVEFGLLGAAGYRPRVVRLFRLDPRPFVFPKPTVIEGWGVPDRLGTQDNRDIFLYDSGLIVTFDAEGINATNMFFLLPQQTALGGEPAPGPQPSAPAPAPGAPSPAPPRR